MANTTVYPYGTGGSLPSSIGIINDLKTGGVDKALSAEMGKYLGNQVDGTPDNFTPLRNLNSSAVEVVDDVSIVSDFFPCKGGDTIIWHHGYASPENDKRICFYDKDKNYITGQYYGATVATERTITIGDIATIAYARASCSALADVWVKVNNATVWQRSDSVPGIDETVTRKAAADDLDLVADGSERNYIEGKLQRSGSSTSVNFQFVAVGYGVTHEIPCLPGDVVIWDSGRPSSGAADADYIIAFYNENSGYVGYYSAAAGASRTVIAPTNSAKLRIGFKIGSGAYVNINGFEAWRENGGQAAAGNEEVILYNEGSYDLWNAEYASVNYGTFTGSSINSRTSFIEIGDYDEIRLVMSKVSTRSDAGLCFYDVNGTFISGVFPSCCADFVDQTDYGWRTVTKPANAKYMVTTIFNTLKSHFSLIGIKSAEIASEKDMTFRSLQETFADRVVIGAPQFYLSEAVSDTAVSLNNKTVAELYAEYDALATAYPDFVHRDSDPGTVTDGGVEYTVRAYTFGFNRQTVIDHEPTASEVIAAADNKWSSANNPRKILVVSGMHGDEKTPTWGLVLALKDILESDAPWAAFIKANAILKVIPCINPGGWNACRRSDSEGNNINGIEAINDAEVTYYFNWVEANKDAFILLDFHGTQGRYAYFPVMDKYPWTASIVKLANQLAPAFYNNWKAFYDAQVEGYGTTYAPFMVGKTNYPKDYIGTGRTTYEVEVRYGVKAFTLETPDNLTTGAINNNDLRNCKLTKDIAINALQHFINLPYMPDSF